MLDKEYKISNLWTLWDKIYGFIADIYAFFGAIDFDSQTNKRNKDLFTSDKFLVDLSNLSVTCPNKVTTFNKSHAPNSNSFTFYFPKEQCFNCPLRKQCTTNKIGRTVNVSKFQEILNADKSYLETDSYKGVKKYRWQLEGLNGTLKSQEKLGDIPYRGLVMTNMHVRLIGIVRNLKTLYKKTFSLLSPTSSVPLIS